MHLYTAVTTEKLVMTANVRLTPLKVSSVAYLFPLTDVSNKSRQTK